MLDPREVEKTNKFQQNTDSDKKRWEDNWKEWGSWGTLEESKARTEPVLS